MRYRSTRGGAQSVSFTEAVAHGLAPDGGLYLPEEFPDLSPYIDHWENLPYPELCVEFFKHFATDLEDADLTRSLSLLGHCVHYPYVSIVHNWGRGNYRSFYLMLVNIYSSFLYFKK